MTDRHVRGRDVTNKSRLSSGIQLPKRKASVRVTRYGEFPGGDARRRYGLEIPDSVKYGAVDCNNIDHPIANCENEMDGIADEKEFDREISVKFADGIATGNMKR
jgi:hypothetical protein